MSASGQPVVYQPGPVGPVVMMATSAQVEAVAGVPPGLEHLLQTDQIRIIQKVDALEVLCSCERNSKYEVKNSSGQKIYKAKERNDCCTRNCCGSLRSFDMKIEDDTDREVMRLIRPYRCSCGCCCLQELKVQAPPGTTIGYVKQKWHPWVPKFAIQDAKQNTVMELQGPCCPCNCCGHVSFEITSNETGESIGRISKEWSGFLKEAFTDSDNFGIQFPADLDVNMKAVLMGACFLIDFMFFETDEKEDDDD